MLAKYKAKAEELAKQSDASPASQPASQPASGPANLSRADFDGRLEVLRQRRKPFQDIFEQLKAELDKIPTPAQRQLAEEAAAQSARSAGGTAATRPAPEQNGERR